MSAVLPGTAVSTLIRLDTSGRIASWPDAARLLFDRGADGVRDQPLSVLIDTRQRGACENVLAFLAHEERGAVRTMSVTAARADGSTFEAECSIWRADDGFEVLVRDMSDRSRIEDGLRQELVALRQFSAEQARALDQARDRLTEITETIDEVFWIADAAITRMLYVSPGYERVWGRPCQSLYDTPKSFIDAIHPDDRDRVLRGLLVQRERLPFNHEYRITRPDGKIVWIWDRGFPVRNRDGSVDHYIGVAQDITERKAAEAVARRQETLDAIGQMAGGLAHDFNNVLGMVIGHLDFISLAVPGDSSVRDSVDRALDAAMRGEQLARRLLALARSEPAERRVLCLAAAIEGLEPLLAHAAGTETQLEVRVSAQPAINVDPAELDAAVINLAVNARAAMPEGGRLTLAIDLVDIDAATACTCSVTPGRYASLSVADTGCGMTPEVLRRVGEPFFTTRPVHGGTGLGLSMVHAFVRRSGGAMRIDSQLGVGSTFELLLPTVDLAAPVAVA